MTIKKIVLVVFTMILNQGVGWSEKPNIIFVLTDDMSWGEIGRTGNEIIQITHLSSPAFLSLKPRSFA